MKKIIIILICLFAFPIYGHAESFCDNKTDSEIKSIVSNVVIAYEINTNANNNPYFTIYLTNLGSDMFIIDTASGKSYKGFSATKSELIINTTDSGKHSFEIYSFKCKDKMGTKSVNLPVYNEYYLDELCEGLEAYKQCRKWSGYTASRNQFEEDIRQIKEKLKKIEESKQGTKTEKVWFSKIVKVFLRIWWLIIIIILLCIGIYYAFKDKLKKKSFDFQV